MNVCVSRWYVYTHVVVHFLRWKRFSLGLQRTPNCAGYSSRFLRLMCLNLLCFCSLGCIHAPYCGHADVTPQFASNAKMALSTQLNEIYSRRVLCQVSLKNSRLKTGRIFLMQSRSVRFFSPPSIPPFSFSIIWIHAHRVLTVVCCFAHTTRSPNRCVVLERKGALTSMRTNQDGGGGGGDAKR